jgi:hypothetical protein
VTPEADDRPVPRARRLPYGAVALGVVLCAVMAVRVVLSGETELAASTAALDDGDPREAIVRARRAAGWYAPGAPHVTAAYERLAALGRGAEEHRDDALALFAWRSLRTAALETRWLLPSAADVDRAEREIARLAAKPPLGESPDTAAAARVAAEELARLRRRDAPQPGWVLCLVAGFAAAAVAFVAAARRAADPGGRLAWARARVPLVVGALGLGCWLLALWRA